MKTQTLRVTPDRFMGFPIGSFKVEERRSLTVHLEDAGMFDVLAHDEDSVAVYAGRYETFDQAAVVAEGMNRVWKSAPQSTPQEILAFVLRLPIVAALEKLCDDADQASYHLSRHNERTRAAALDERIEQARSVNAPIS